MGATRNGCWRWARVGRRDLRLKVADKRDWFAVEGGAQVERRGGAAVRRCWRHPRGAPLRAGGQARLRAHRETAAGGAGARRGRRVSEAARRALQLAAVATDPLLDLVEDEAQIEASAAFAALRRRMREGDAR